MGKPFSRAFTLGNAIVSPCRTILTIAANSISGSVGHVNSSTLAKTHYNLALTIKVPVIANDILLIILKIAHIRTTVYPPKNSTVKFQTLHDGIFAIMAIYRETIINFFTIVKFLKNFHNTITINIDTTCIVRNESRSNHFRMLRSYLKITCLPWCHLTAHLVTSMLYCLNLIGIGSRILSVIIVRHRKTFSNL